VQTIAREAGRNPNEIEPALYLTLAIDENAVKAEERMNNYLSAYYGQRPDIMKKRQACFSGSASAAADWLNAYVQEDARYLVLRCAGDHDRHLETIAKLRKTLA
jgi:alkanesulfonate monooxygenase SsuD/methylene tetrahydromethanopterin reductase-like flavin-dependent oxidoreductase (luciferase family)